MRPQATSAAGLQNPGTDTIIATMGDLRSCPNDHALHRIAVSWIADSVRTISTHSRRTNREAHPRDGQTARIGAS